MKAFLLAVLLCSRFFAATAGGASDSHARFSAVLADYVKDGRVSYGALMTDARLGRYLDQLAATDPAALAGEPERLALWLNAYNAYTLKLIVDHALVKSITEIGTGGLLLGSLLKTTAWDIRFATIGGKKFTLNEIEHEIIRRQFKDARVHFALVCASASCPVLRTEAYEAGALDRQLDEQARLFVRDPIKNRFEVATKTAQISSIFKWYGSDFGTGEKAVLLAIAKYATEEVRRVIEVEPTAWKVEYLAYDWSLNASAEPMKP